MCYNLMNIKIYSIRFHNMAHSYCETFFVGQMGLEVSYQKRIFLECSGGEYFRLLDVEEAFEVEVFGYSINEKGDK